MVLGNKKENEEIDLGEIDPNIIEEGEEETPPFDIDEGEEDSPFEQEEDEEAPPFEGGDSPSFGEEQKVIPPSMPSSEFDEKITSLEDKVNQMDSTLANVRRLHEELEEKINKVEKSLEEMLSVYELVTNEINPFVQKQGEALVTSSPSITETTESAEVEDKKESSPIREHTEPPEPSIGVSVSKQGMEDFSFQEPMERIFPEGGNLYLPDIKNDPVSIMILLKWIEFMLKKVGFRGMVNLLLYYENIGWISEKVRNKILKYAREMKIEDKIKTKKMRVKDHLISLYFITKLQGLKIDTKVYSSVAYELEKIGILE